MTWYNKLFPWRTPQTKITDWIFSRPYLLGFKVTNYCWYKCAHCCESAGPDQPREYMPINMIRDYLAAANSDENFKNFCILTGGEIMSAYRFAGASYVPDLVNMCMERNQVNIKTNAAWAGTDFGRRIFDDIGNIVRNHAPYHLSLSLSLDKYHPNSMRKCIHTIKTLAKMKNLPIIIGVASFADDTAAFGEMLHQLQSHYGFNIKETSMQSDDRNVFLINDSIRLINSTGAELNPGGRAGANLNIPQDPLSVFQALSADETLIVAFDAFGRALLGENTGNNISTKWRDNAGNCRPLSDIISDLYNNMKSHEIALIKSGRIK